MKRFSGIILLALLCLFITGCSVDGVDGGEINFDAVIIELDGDRVVAEPLEGDKIRKSADRISFSREDLDDIGEKIGDTITVTYLGEVMESYPAQVRAVSWSILTDGK